MLRRIGYGTLLGYEDQLIAIALHQNVCPAVERARNVKSKQKEEEKWFHCVKLQQ